VALLFLLLGISAIKTTPTDIFPEIDIPVVTVVWQYTGLSPDQMAKHITTFSEYTILSAVDNVKNIVPSGEQNELNTSTQRKSKS
jgi:multidrug efflux pump subunit AcrB